MSTTLKWLFIGISLQAYYFEQIRLALFSVLSLVLMAMILLPAIMSNDRVVRPAAALVGVYVVALACAAVGLVFYGEGADQKRLLGFLTVILSTVVAGHFFKHVFVEDAVRTYLKFHISFFYLQFFLYYFAGITVDFLAPITGEEQRMFGGSFSFPLIDRFMRAAGLFSEPGTYATFVAPFVALFERCYGKKPGDSRLFWLALCSLFLSLSIFGIIFSALIFLFSKNVRLKHRLVGLSLGFAVISPFIIYRFFVRASLGLDTGVELRELFLENSLAFLSSDPLGFLFGANLLSIDPRAELGASSNDAGMFFYLLHFGGVPFTMFVLALVGAAFLRCDRPSRMALAILLLSKQSPFIVLFPFIVIAILLAPARKVGIASTRISERAYANPSPH